jgi:1,4-dihydroxy-2-naphthoyl-CoA hydrolase
VQSVVEGSGEKTGAPAVIVLPMTDTDPFTESLGFDAFYGLEILELTPELARARLVVRPEHKQAFGLVHGGIYATIAESLTSVATAKVVLAAGNAASGMSNQTSFLRPVTDGTIHATAARKHAGRTTWVWEVEMSDDEGRLCALTRMTIAVRELRPEARARLGLS